MRALGIIGLLIVLVVGYTVYSRSASEATGGASPQEQIDVTAIRQRLLTIARTERQYQAQHGNFATLQELMAADLLPEGTQQRGYTFSAEILGAGFIITATPTDPTKKDWPTLSINETLTVTER